MSIGACLFILFSNADSDSLCMMGPEEKRLIEEEQQINSGDYTQLGTVESQLSLQEAKAEELKSIAVDASRALETTKDMKPS